MFRSSVTLTPSTAPSAAARLPAQPAHRRQFLHRGAAASLALAAPWACAQQTPVDGLVGAPLGGCAHPAVAFAKARSQQPWSSAFASMAGDLPPLAMRTTHGRLPANLSGVLLRNGPAAHGWGDVRYHHWFDGDGAVQRYRFGASGVVHDARYVRTPKYLADVAAGRATRPTFGTAVAGAVVGAADELNVANTSIVAHGGRLLALWEGGSATELDPHTLHTRGPVVWSPQTQGAPFSAHPRVDVDGSMWNFGLSALTRNLVIYRIGADGRLLHASALRLPDAPMMHDFAITEHHLVLPMPPLVLDAQRLREGASYLDAHVWRPELGLRVLVLHKERLDAPRWFELPAGMVFHVGNACEEGGVIRMDAVVSHSAWHARQGLKDVMCGQHHGLDHAHFSTVELNLSDGRARMQRSAIAAEFPRVDPRRVGRRYTQVYTLGMASARQAPGWDCVQRVEAHSGAIDRHPYGPQVMVEEHVFVPRAAGSGAETDGWLVGTALDIARQQTLFSVFDAAKLSAGPVYQAAMRRTLPLGLHAQVVRESL